MAKCVLPGYEESSPEDQRDALTLIFQRLFSTDDGKVVFNALLTDLLFFDEAHTEAQKALSEYSKFFMRERMGITNTLDASNALMKTMR